MSDARAGVAPDGHQVALISIVLPIHNQADHLEALVGDYLRTLRRLPVPGEILLMVNGSRDESAPLARKLEEAHAEVRAFESAEGGWGRAIKQGIAAARGDLICYTNSARTSAEDLTLLLLYAVAYPGVVIKVNRRVRDQAYRRLGSLLYNLECRMLFELSCWDVNGTPKIFPRTCTGLLDLQRDDDLIDLEFNIVCRRESYRMLEVPISSTKRHGGSSTTTWLSAVRLYWGAYQLWRAGRQRAS